MNVNWTFLNCRKHQENISLLAARRLPEAEWAGLEVHLAKCAECRNDLARLRALSQGLETWRVEQADREPGRDAQFRLRSALRAVAQTGGARSAAIPGRGNSERPGIWGFLATLFYPKAPSLRVLTGALAAVWAMILFLNLDTPSLPVSREASRRVSAKELLMVLKAVRNYPASLENQEDAPWVEPVSPSHSQRRGGREALKTCC